VLSDSAKAAYRDPAMAEEECQSLTSDSSHSSRSSRRNTSSTHSDSAVV